MKLFFRYLSGCAIVRKAITHAIGCVAKTSQVGIKAFSRQFSILYMGNLSQAA